MFEKLWKARIIIFCGNLLCIAAFGLFGYWLDLRTGVKPRYTILFVLVSFPFSQIVTIKLLRRSFPKSTSS